MAFNAKNLHYEKQEPAFLRRLRAGNTDERTTVSVARPRNARLEMGDDDGPTIVDERGENVTLEEYENRSKAKSKNEDLDEKDPAESNTAKEPSSPNLKTRDGTSGRIEGSKQDDPQPTQLYVTTGPKKRKQFKAIEIDPEPEPPVAEAKTPLASKVNPMPKNKSKRRKVKLSFDQPTD